MSLHVPAKQSHRVEARRGSDQLAHVRLKGLSESNVGTVQHRVVRRGRNDEGHGTSLMKRRSQRSLYGEEEAALKGTLLRLFSTDSHLARKLAFEMIAAPTAECDEREENEEKEYSDDLD
jgi:hypothetical protein